MDSDYGIARELSDLQKLRSRYQPELPPCLQVSVFSKLDVSFLVLKVFVLIGFNSLWVFILGFFFHLLLRLGFVDLVNLG